MSKYESIWDLMNNYLFQIDTDEHNELTCAICMNIMVNAHQSICGCRYCLNCIMKYLNGADKYCPGSTNDCKEQIISSEKGIQIDHVANMKVSKIIVKCPESDCHFVDELRNIEDHMISHRVKCPYFEIGCNQKLSAKVDEHLYSNQLFHSNLMMDTIQNLKNELSTIQEISEKKDIDTQLSIDQLKKSNLDDRELIQKLLRDMASSNTINLQLKGELASMKNEINMMKVNNNKKLIDLTAEINKFHLKTENNQVHVNVDKTDKTAEIIDKISEKVKQNTKNIVANTQKINKNSQKIGANSQKINKNTQNIENYSKSHLLLKADLAALMSPIGIDKTVIETSSRISSEHITEMITPETAVSESEKSPENANDIEKLKRNAKSLRKGLNKINNNKKPVNKNFTVVDLTSGSQEAVPVKQPTVRVAFRWVIDQFSEKRKHAKANGDWFMLSEPFYTDADGTGYKLCLTVYPNGVASTNNTQLSLGFHVMQGEHDNRLKWPLCRDISIGLVDQEAGIITLAETYNYQSTPDKNKYRFQRPVTGMNSARGSSSFIGLAELFGNIRLYKNDSIVLQCIVATTI